MKAKIVGEEFADNCLYMVIDGDDSTAWAVTSEEIPAIRDACDEWLKENHPSHSQSDIQ